MKDDILAERGDLPLRAVRLGVDDAVTGTFVVLDLDLHKVQVSPDRLELTGLH